MYQSYPSSAKRTGTQSWQRTNGRIISTIRLGLDGCCVCACIKCGHLGWKKVSLDILVEDWSVIEELSVKRESLRLNVDSRRRWRKQPMLKSTCISIWACVIPSLVLYGKVLWAYSDSL